MTRSRLTLIVLGLLTALCLTGTEMQTRCRLTHYAAGEPEMFILSPDKALVSVEARAALPGDNPTGIRSKSSWGVEFDNGLRVSLCRGNTDYGSEYNTQTLLVSVSQGDSLLLEDVLDYGLSAKASEYHTVKLMFGDGGLMQVYAGSRDLFPVLSLTLPASMPRPTEVRSVAQARKWVPAYLWVEETDSHAIPVYPYDSDALSRVGSGVGGMWQMFDRENDNRYAVPGGEYTLACIPDPDTDGGYLLLVTKGARKCPELWPPGSLKGRLSPTPFKKQYALTWTAADGTPLTDEAYALLSEDQQLLTLVFPLHRATLRFSRRR